MALEWRRKGEKRVVGGVALRFVVSEEAEEAVWKGEAEREKQKDEGRRGPLPLFGDYRFLGPCLEETLVSRVQGHPS